jgi:hypothetical protein
MNAQAAPTRETTLPLQFAHLESFVPEWAIGTEKARAEKRVATPIPALREFQQELLPHLEPMIQFFNQLPNDSEALPPDAKRLYHLAQMVMEASAPLDLNWTSPDIEDVFPLERIRFLPPSI